ADDYFTQTAAMNIGLFARQDVVIFGGFVVKESSTQEAPIMEIQIAILDIGKQKVISDFTMKNPIDNTIFETVDKIAERIVKEASAVLPSKEDFAKGRFHNPIPSFAEIAVRGLYAPVAIAANTKVQSNSSQTSGDFKQILGFQADFHYFGILFEQLGAYASFCILSASNNFTLEIDNSTIPVNLQTLTGGLGVAWREKFYPKWYAQPWIGIAFRVDTVQYQLQSDTVNIYDTAGRPISQQDLRSTIPVFALGSRIGYMLNRRFSLEAGIQYNLLMLSTDLKNSILTDFGVGFKF
ncbi:MAG: hypothetical protein D6767_07865, partial [Candidatus Hydrogenedentota bacterium]